MKLLRSGKVISKIMSKNSSHLAAFTLSETLVVLLITVSLIGIGSLQLEPIKEQLVMQSAVNQFEMAQSWASRHSILQHKAVFLSYSKQNNQLKVTSSVAKRTFDLPDGINLSAFSQSYSSNGATSPKTVVLMYNSQRRVLTTQMNWGKVIEK